MGFSHAKDGGGCYCDWVEFITKVDTWFLAGVYGSGAVMLAMATLLRGRPLAIRILLTVFAIVLVFIGITVPGVTYGIAEDGDLESRGFWGSGTISHVDNIQSITPSTDLRASEAVSTDRLRIERTDGTTVLIAVRDKKGFLEAVVKASTVLHRDGFVVTRQAPPPPMMVSDGGRNHDCLPQIYTLNRSVTRFVSPCNDATS
jgi:hypothetical protein